MIGMERVQQAWFQKHTHTHPLDIKFLMFCRKDKLYQNCYAKVKMTLQRVYILYTSSLVFFWNMYGDCRVEFIFRTMSFFSQPNIHKVQLYLPWYHHLLWNCWNIKITFFPHTKLDKNMITYTIASSSLQEMVWKWIFEKVPFFR